MPSVTIAAAAVVAATVVAAAHRLSTPSALAMESEGSVLVERMVQYWLHHREKLFPYSRVPFSGTSSITILTIAFILYYTIHYIF
jgi:hypothetical protein